MFVVEEMYNFDLFFLNRGGVSKDPERGFINDHVGYTNTGRPLGKMEITE
jgi:hypothetical protein